MKKKLKLLFRFWMPPLGWMVLIFFLSSIPDSRLPRVPYSYVVHKIVHCIEYSFLGIFVFRAFLNSLISYKTLKLILITLGLVFLYAVLDEWHQTFVAGRFGDFSDVVFDTIYAFVGIYFFYHSPSKKEAILR